MKNCEFCNLKEMPYHYIDKINGIPREIEGSQLVGKVLMGENEVEEPFCYELHITRGSKSPYIATTDGEHIPVNYCPICGRNLEKDYKEYIKWNM